MTRPIVPLLIVTLALTGCDDGQDAPAFQGYMEADLILVAPDEGGRLVRLSVEEGADVEAGAPLFALNAELFEARAEEARARLAEAEATLANLKAQQQRPEEIDVLQAGKRRAEADLALSTQALKRQRELYDRGVASRARLDEAEAAYRRDKAALEEITQRIGTARLSAREAEIAIAAAGVEAARASLAQAETRLDRRTVAAPASGVVEEVYYRPGEWVAAGRPVLSILPPANLRVRFFVPEPLLSSIEVGQPVAVGCDGCPDDLEARIVFVSPEAEFTPPVIFGPEERAKLVFMVEASPIGKALELHPGQPVTVIATAAGAP